jgi:DNA-binding transcriptional regulator YdaS (Cro superfamily)
METTEHTEPGAHVEAIKALIARCGSARAAARLLNCSDVQLSRYAKGEREVPNEFAERVRAALATPAAIAPATAGMHQRDATRLAQLERAAERAERYVETAREAVQEAERRYNAVSTNVYDAPDSAPDTTPSNVRNARWREIVVAKENVERREQDARASREAITQYRARIETPAHRALLAEFDAATAQGLDTMRPHFEKLAELEVLRTEVLRALGTECAKVNGAAARAHSLAVRLGFIEPEAPAPSLVNASYCANRIVGECASLFGHPAAEHPRTEPLDAAAARALRGWVHEPETLAALLTDAARVGFTCTGATPAVEVIATPQPTAPAVPRAHVEGSEPGVYGEFNVRSPSFVRDAE